MKIELIDYIIIILYLTGIVLFGIIKGGKQKSIKDYFLGSKQVPWWAVCFSIVAAETSTLTFISVPGLAYLTNLNFLQLAIGYVLGRIVVAMIFIPAYYKGELSTAYLYLENRFGKQTRTYASIVFLFTRIAADGVRLFATAIPLYLMLDLNPVTAIIIIAVVALIYTYSGGVKGVIWVDVIQMFIYLGGAITAGIYILSILPDGWNSVIAATSGTDKFSIFNFGFDLSFKEFFNTPYTLLGGLIGGAFLSMASHGTDQFIVQRLLTTENISGSKKAVVYSGVIVLFQFAIFLVLGVLLYAYYGVLDVKSDEIFPMFIIDVLPPVITGIIIAGIFAAALSSLAGSISSLSSSAILDIYKNIKVGSDKSDLKISRYMTIFWAVMLTLSAMFFMNSSQTVVELALSIASFTYGGLLGTFLLGILNKKAKQRDALVAFSVGLLVMIVIISLSVTAWTWYILIGVTATILTGTIFALFNTED